MFETLTILASVGMFLLFVLYKFKGAQLDRAHKRLRDLQYKLEASEIEVERREQNEREKTAGKKADDLYADYRPTRPTDGESWRPGE